MKKLNKTTLLTSLICLLPILVGAILYSRLPETVATHWNMQGEPDGWSSRPFAVFGLPGILLAMGNAERTEPLTMIGPKGLEKVVRSLRVIAPELPFEIRFIEFRLSRSAFNSLD